MKNLLSFCVLSLSLCIQAQVVPDEFGNVKPEYLSMKNYPGDDQAEAVVLYDFGKTYFIDTDYGFRILFERTTKIKILTKAGIKYANVEIPYYVEKDEMERILSIDGYTFNFESGSLMRTKLDSKTIFEEKLNDHVILKKFALPDVKEGSVIEYKYKVESPYFVNLHDWEFQSSIPTIYSEYTVAMIPFYEYSYIFQGAKKFDVFKNTQTSMKRNFGGIEYADNVFTFGMKNVPAFRDEAFITSVNDYIMKIDFQLAVLHHLNGANVEYITTWPLLNEKLLKLPEFGLYIKNSAKNAGIILASLGISSLPPLEKADMIFRYVKSNYNWDGYYSKFAGKSSKDFLKTKTGNTADINLFLCAMLNEAGLDAYPVILSTRSNGKIPVDFPFQQFLNYVIVMTETGGKRYLLDATESLAQFGMLPVRCINNKGLIVDKERTEWVQLIDEAVSFETDSVRIAFNPEMDSASVSTTVISSGHRALDLRRSFITDPEKFRNDMMSGEMRMKMPLKTINLTEIEKPFTYDYMTSVLLESVSDKLLVNPFPGLVPTENPLKISFRNYPVDMIYSKTYNFISVIEVPKGYKFAEGIKDVNIDNALVTIRYSSQNTADNITIEGSYTFKKAVYFPHEYFELKKLYTTIVETFNNKIILQKTQ